jgi:hypothetical protein
LSSPSRLPLNSTMMRNKPGGVHAITGLFEKAFSVCSVSSVATFVDAT